MKTPELTSNPEIEKEVKQQPPVTEKTEQKPKEPATNDDLLSRLKEATERKPDPKEKPAGQEPGTEQKTDSTQSPSPEPGHFRPPMAELEPVRNIPPMPKDQQAKLLIAFVDGLDCLILPWAYQKSIFTKDEWIQLKKIKKIKESTSKSLAAFRELSDSDKELLSRYNDFKEIEEDIPFTKSEIDRITTPLAAVMEKYNFNMSCEVLLFSALATIMTPRIMPLFNKLERL